MICVVILSSDKVSKSGGLMARNLKVVGSNPAMVTNVK
jgi:hypothetical protein